MATDRLAQALQGTTQTAAQGVRETLQQGMGFLSPQNCPSNPSYNNALNEFNRPSFNASSDSSIKAWDTQNHAPTPPDSTGIYGFEGQQQYDADQKLYEMQKDSYERERNTAVYDARKKWDEKNTCPGGLKIPPQARWWERR